MMTTEKTNKKSIIKSRETRAVQEAWSGSVLPLDAKNICTVTTTKMPNTNWPKAAEDASGRQVREDNASNSQEAALLRDTEFYTKIIS